MQIDHYGFEAQSQWFLRRELEPHMIKRVDGVIYVCFHNSDPRPIHKIEKNDSTGVITVTWSYGTWANAVNLRYQPINQTMEV